mmetsp:Transcript_4509/g.10050  ORF Transcript_4509/g.10050 Transcript_4509/m.10050 type:complete len:82 (-) Transcript_4509:1886-2131(-)
MPPPPLLLLFTTDLAMSSHGHIRMEKLFAFPGWLDKPSREDGNAEEVILQMRHQPSQYAFQFNHLSEGIKYNRWLHYKTER